MAFHPLGGTVSVKSNESFDILQLSPAMGMGVWVERTRFLLHCKSERRSRRSAFAILRLPYRETDANKSECSNAWNWLSSLL